MWEDGPSTEPSTEYLSSLEYQGYSDGFDGGKATAETGDDHYGRSYNDPDPTQLAYFQGYEAGFETGNDLDAGTDDTVPGTTLADDPSSTGATDPAPATGETTYTYNQPALHEDQWFAAVMLVEGLQATPATLKTADSLRPSPAAWKSPATPTTTAPTTSPSLRCALPPPPSS